MRVLSANIAYYTNRAKDQERVEKSRREHKAEEKKREEKERFANETGVERTNRIALERQQREAAEKARRAAMTPEQRAREDALRWAYNAPAQNTGFSIRAVNALSPNGEYLKIVSLVHWCACY